MQPTRAVVRGISRTYQQATVMRPRQEAIDLDRAADQHGAYVAALQVLGLQVTQLPAQDRFPDGCFVEDTAIIAGTLALITRAGIASRRGEEAAVRDALAAQLSVQEMGPRGTLEGGDVLVVGRDILVGLSARTDEAGRHRVQEVFAPLGFRVRSVPVGTLLHLKCGCSQLDRETVLVADGAFPEGTFAGLRTVRVPAEELYAANCVAVGRDVLVSAGYPRAEQAVRDAGFHTHVLAMSEISKGDGSLTCLSLLF